MIDYLEWDSKFFGLRIAKVQLCTQDDNDLLTKMKEELRHDYDLIYLFVNGNTKISLNNAYLVDRKVIYSKEVNSSTTNDESIISYNKDTVSTDLLQLALESGEYSRFKLDARFPQNSYEKLYTCWIEQSVSHKIASDVFCYMVEGRARGLLTLKVDNNNGEIGLVSTNHNYRGHGIASKLLEHANNYLYQLGGSKLSVATQFQNKPACHLYEKSGFSIDSCIDIWHWWLNF